MFTAQTALTATQTSLHSNEEITAALKKEVKTLKSQLAAATAALTTVAVAQDDVETLNTPSIAKQTKQKVVVEEEEDLKAKLVLANQSASTAAVAAAQQQLVIDNLKV